MATRLVRLTLIDGDPDGLRTVEIAGRTTKLIACPLSKIDRLLQRGEANRPAVYFLYGQRFEQDGEAIYIGECDAVARRFNGRHHAMEKADWRQLVAGFSSDSVFNKAHARRAEHLLTERVRIAGRVEVLTDRSGPGELDEGDSAFAAQFVEDVTMLAETLGFQAFRVPAPQPATQLPADRERVSDPADDIFHFVGETRFAARMRVSGDDFVVLTGSLARPDETSGCAASIRALRHRAREDGVLVLDEGTGLLRLTRDFAVSSTSAAGGLVAGRNSRGPNEWVHESLGQTYAQWLERKQSEGAAERA